MGNAYLHHRILEPILDNVIAAERQGYAAFVMGSFSDPFMREMRSAVDIERGKSAKDFLGLRPAGRGQRSTGGGPPGRGG